MRQFIRRQRGQGMVEVVVADNGRGMAPDVLAHAFDSFFTTKSQGMGLGLAISKMMIESNGGTVTVGDALDGGARIVLSLPMT